MLWDMRKVFFSSTILPNPGNVQKETTQKKRQKKGHATCEYHLRTDGVNLQVCKTMYLNMFNLKEWMVRHWVDVTSSNELKSAALLNLKNFT